MFGFIIKLEVMRRVAAQNNQTFREWQEMHGRDTTPMKINGSKTISWFERVLNITSTS